MIYRAMGEIFRSFTNPKHYEEGCYLYCLLTYLLISDKG